MRVMVTLIQSYKCKLSSRDEDKLMIKIQGVGRVKRVIIKVNS